jgi:triphosphoribosyl-dephospho-CoA synthase
MEAAVHEGVGGTVLAAVKATRALVRTNTNLGTILLLAPLAAVPASRLLRDGAAAVLAGLSADDAHKVYEAIRLVQPGGLGRVDAMDVHDDPPADLLAAMRLASGRDLVARQYAEGFVQVFELAAPWLVEGKAAGWTLTQAIVHTHVRLLSQFHDSLIVRKRGVEAADAASRKAAAVLRAGKPGDESYERALADLDFWLRSDSRGRNPGTVADLVAAGLFVVLRDGLIWPPYR